MTNCKVLKVNICSGLDTVEGLLGEIKDLLSGELTVSPNEDWEALLENAFTSALENADITVSVNDPISVSIDTSDGPVEITGNVTAVIDGTVQVEVTNFPTSISVDNFNELDNLNVVIANEEPIEISLSGPDKQLLIDISNAINNTIRVDWEKTDKCVFRPDPENEGEYIVSEPCIKQYIERRYTNTGVFISAIPVLSAFNEDGTVSSYELAEGEKVRTCPINGLDKIIELLENVIGDPSDGCGCDDETINGCSEFENTYQVGLETDITFSSNETTLKWDKSSENEIGLAFTQDITRCIDTGGSALIRYSDGGVDTHEFTATSYVASDITTTFTGTAGETTGSGKLNNAVVICSCRSATRG